jgi:hypothetical protein
MRARGAVVVALVACALHGACGGDGGGGGGPTNPTPSITFTGGGAASNAFVLQSAAASGEVLTLELAARSVADLYAVACDLTYPPALRYSGFTAGPLLASGGVSISVQVAESPPGRLVIGATRLGAVEGLASASGVVLSLQFAAAAAGNGTLAFIDPRAFDERGQAIAGLDWSGGSVVVVR